MTRSFISALIISIIASSVPSFGQVYVFAKEGNEVLIKGTSNLHDWQMNVITSSGEVKFAKDGNQLKGIEMVEFSCKTSDIKSENSIMDKKAYEALKANAHQIIRFSLLANKELISEERKFRGSIKGRLFIAGITKEIDVPFTGHLNEDNTISLEGSVDLLMSDFKINPPTALLGALKTGNKVTVHFALRLLSKT